MRLRTGLVLVVAMLAVGCALATEVRAQEPDHPPGEVLRTGQMVRSLLASRASRLGTSAGPDPDTVYVGKSFTNHTAPDNYWNLHVGTYRPGTNDANNALWDWDNSVGIQAPDSLHGWWPYQREYLNTSGLVLADSDRPWWAVDDGNVGNFVLSQGAAAKRTFGVVGYWHDDPGITAGGGVLWSPLAGSRSAWCGMRQHGDLTVQDLVTGNHYSGEAVAMYGESTINQQVIKRLPGYLDQMDQMLYRDLVVPPGQPLSVSFLYRTRMSTTIITAAATRTGWFHGDPLAVTAGNFISSSSAGANAPQDSFMVYVGAPVDDAACVYSDGVTRPVYDKQRRWFSEVLKLFGPGASVHQIFGAAGNQPADTLSATPLASIVVPEPTIASILASSPGGVVRLVFRVKTNRTHSDADTKVNGYSSLGRGAAQVDEVTIDRGVGPELIGDFETAQQGGVNAIDNRFPLPPGLNATQVWRSTGKPAPTYVHLEPLAGLAYEDLCGPPDSPARQCNLAGLVLATGNHDVGEQLADARWSAFRETRTYIMSPTINLVPGPGGTANSMGITSSIAHASEDYLLRYDLYWGFGPFAFSGVNWNIGYQSYPTLQTGNGGKTWSDRHYYQGTLSSTGPECFTDFAGFADLGIPLTTSNLSGIPDSLRLLLGIDTQCFRFSITLGCNSANGAYFDNVSLVFVDQPGVPGQASAGSAVSLGTITSDIWRFVNDTFPANETAGLPGTPAFDTTSALIRSGINISQATLNTLRFDIPGDSSIVFASNATVSAPDNPALATVRVDLVFRILPGPGNYQLPPPIGPAAVAPSMAPGGSFVSGTMLQLPTNQATAAVAGDGSFWGQYMADPGLVSAGVHSGAGGWDPLTWNSCRMDTVQNNIFPVGGTVPTSTGLTPGQYMTMIHEGDPKFATLGVAKNRCFVVDTLKAATSTPALANVVCDGTVPPWLTAVPQSRTGWDGQATTKEFTKILPDGLLTPGSHVQYFYRKSHSIDAFLNHALCPDTNFITPQPREGSTDPHRWQQFGVLPDRWKSPAYGGLGSACMLYVDVNDRRGNEGRFVSIMDSIGATASDKFGAHNGWHAPGTTNLINLDVRTDLSVAVSRRNSQPGTSWDMYGAKATESSGTSAGGLGSRLANRTNMGFAAGRESRQGPTPEMLRTYYRMLAMLSGDLSSSVLGPFLNRGQDDIALLNDFLTAAGGTPRPRGLFVQGDGFAESALLSDVSAPVHAPFLTDKLGIQLRSRSYVGVSGNLEACADLLTTTALTPGGDVYGVQSGPCQWGNEVFEPNPAMAEASAAAYYENVGPNGPYVSDVIKTAVPARNWIALTSGYDIEHLLGRYCDHTWGSWMYYYNAFNTVFGSLCQLTGACTPCLDTPQTGRVYANFMKIGDALMRHGTSTVRLGIAQSGRVQVNVYDVAGRKVRTLADRVFPAGEQAFVWDGADDGGRKVGRGVYFVRSSTQRDAGRIVVLNH